MTAKKEEPGLSSRLTSFRVPRDLTLSANVKAEKPSKKVYTPNINVQRNRSRADPAVPKSEPGPSKGRGRPPRGRGQNDRGRGRGKQSNAVQSTGIFSEGIADLSRSSRRSSGYARSGGGERDSKAFLEKPKLNLNHIIDKADDEEKLKLLLRDDFIDDGTDGNIENAPIALPLIDEAKLFKSETKVKVEIDDEVDEKPVILENGEAIAPPKQRNLKDSTVKEDKCSESIPQIIENASNTYVMLRFPDCLPGFRTDDTSDVNSKPIIDEKSIKPESKPGYCTLKSLKAGLLGKIQIHQSGKARLILGDNSLVIDIGSRLGFRQDVLAAKLEEDNNELVNLGPITSTLICTPDFESILAKI